MQKFLNLPAEKQTAIIDAAMLAFGKNGYKKASISDIANAAGISKAMVFHYFGTKKELYFYLVSYCNKLVIKELDEKFDYSVTDFFDRIKLSSDIKMALLKKHPEIFSFIMSSYFETDEEVKGCLKDMVDKSEGYRDRLVFDGTDTSKFKDGIDVKLVMKMLMWMADGFANTYKEMVNNDNSYGEFFDCVELMRNNFYKKEYIGK
jgi:AcrR family transcriptional regulator